MKTAQMLSSSIGRNEFVPFMGYDLEIDRYRSKASALGFEGHLVIANTM